jgi:hypothetical protein
MADSLAGPTERKRNLECWMGEHAERKEGGAVHEK